MELVLRWIANQQGSSRGNISQKVEAGSICAHSEKMRKGRSKTEQTASQEAKITEAERHESLHSLFLFSPLCSSASPSSPSRLHTRGNRSFGRKNLAVASRGLQVSSPVVSLVKRPRRAFNPPRRRIPFIYLQNNFPPVSEK